MDDIHKGSTSPGRERRKSFIDMLNSRSVSNSSTASTSPSSFSNSVPSSGHRGSLSQALGLAGSPISNTPYAAFQRQRRASISTSNASETPTFRNSFDENAVIEEDDKVADMQVPPSPSFSRRLSFGAQAMASVRGGGSPGNNAGRRPSLVLFALKEDHDVDEPGGKPVQLSANTARSVSGTAKTAGEGFNWSDAMKDRSKRSSISGNPFAGLHNRSKSIASPTMPEPPREMPAPAPIPVPVPLAQRMKKPDHLGERMLRGDFMMD